MKGEQHPLLAALKPSAAGLEAEQLKADRDKASARAATSPSPPECASGGVGSPFPQYLNLVKRPPASIHPWFHQPSHPRSLQALTQVEALKKDNAKLEYRVMHLIRALDMLLEAKK